MNGRALVVAGAAQLAVSLSLLLIASMPPEERLPRWGGPIDVALAFSIVATLIVLHRAAADRVGIGELRTGYRVAATLPAVMLVLLWLFRDSLIWNVLLPGLAWRSFVLLSALPMALAVWRGR